MEFRTPLTDVISIHAPQWGATSAYHQSPAGALFQSTHPSGVRPTDSAAIVRCKQFQSTHPSGVRPPSGDCGRSATADFNPRTPVGCDSYRHHHNKRFHPFQSTHPSGVRPYALRLRFVSRDFNPRTPVGCDPMSGCRFGRLRISIHAPQWGATATPSPSLSSFVISIHAPQWGATVPYGCVFGVVVISIHAPQWGATRAALEPWARVANFNPRTPVGCDCPAFVTMRRTLIFQSTHPSGVRPLSTTAVRWLWHFNPRTPVGCDCRY